MKQLINGFTKREILTIGEGFLNLTNLKQHSRLEMNELSPNQVNNQFNVGVLKLTPTYDC